jgi:hypothetical protein
VNKPGFGESRLKGVPLDLMTAEQLEENGAALAEFMQSDHLSLKAAEYELRQPWFDHSTGRAYFDGAKVYVVWKTNQVTMLPWQLPLAALEAVRRFLDVDGTTVVFYKGDKDAGFTVRACRPPEQVEEYLSVITGLKQSVEINRDPNDAYLSRDDGGRRAIMRLAQTTGVLPVAVSEQTAPARVSSCPACNAPLPPRAERCSFCNAYIRGA